MVWFTIAGILIVAAYYVALKRRTKKIMSRPSTSNQQVKLMSVEQARTRVDTLIAEGSLLVEPADGSKGLSDHLGPITREFFSRYGAVTTRRGGFRLAASDIRPSEYAAKWLSIGHAEDWDVVQRPSNDEVFVIEGSEANETEMEVRFPTIYHLVVDEAQPG
jgi:hypothetical protein